MKQWNDYIELMNQINAIKIKIDSIDEKITANGRRNASLIIFLEVIIAILTFLLSWCIAILLELSDKI